MSRQVSPWAVRSFAVFLTLAFGRIGPLPFVRFPAFAFPDMRGAMAIPLFLADGEMAEASDYEAFSGVGPEAVDVEHPGLESVVAHRFYEVQRWIADHPGEGGPVEVVVGVRVLRQVPEGGVVVEDRVGGRGTARRAR